MIEPTIPHWNGGTDFDFEIVGEASYQDNIARVCGGHSSTGHEFECEAYLVPEPDNPYDKNAIKVLIEGLTVGYIPRQLCNDYHRALEGNGYHQDAVLGCSALVVGGWIEADDTKAQFGVKLDIAWPPGADIPGPAIEPGAWSAQQVHAEDASSAVTSQSQHSKQRTPKNLVLAYILWLFLGLLSMHRFYLGRPKTAIAQIASYFLLVGFLWWLVDAFLIPSMTKKASQKALS